MSPSSPKRALTLFLVAVSLTGCGAGKSDGSTSRADVDSVRAAFEAYVEAALSRDGREAADQLSQETHDLYAQNRDDALRLPASELDGLRFSDQVTVMLLRAELEAEELESLSGEEVLAEAFELGLIDESSYSGLELREVAVTGDSAVADAAQGEQEIDDAFLFRREDDGWKLDLVPTIDKANAAFNAQAEKGGLSVRELTDKIVAAKYGPAAVSKLREPLQP